MKLISYFILLIPILLFSNCGSIYLPFEIPKGSQSVHCDNTFCFNTRYKTSLSLNEMSQKLTALNYTVMCDTLYKGKKMHSPYLSISNYKIDNIEIEWIHFTVFESQEVVSFYGFCLKKPLLGTEKDIIAQSKAIRYKIEKDIAPLLLNKTPLFK